MDFSRTVHTLTLPSLTAHSQISTPRHLKAVGSRHKSYFQLYRSCKNIEEDRIVRSFIATILKQSFLFHRLQTHCAQHVIKMTLTCYLTVWIHFFVQSCCALYVLSPVFLLTFPLHFFPPTPFIFITEFCSCTSTPHSPFLGRIVAWWIVTSSNITAVCSIAMPRDRARVRQASTR